MGSVASEQFLLLQSENVHRARTSLSLSPTQRHSGCRRTTYEVMISPVVSSVCGYLSTFCTWFQFNRMRKGEWMLFSRHMWWFDLKEFFGARLLFQGILQTGCPEWQRALIPRGVQTRVVLVADDLSNFHSLTCCSYWFPKDITIVSMDYYSQHKATHSDHRLSEGKLQKSNGETKV